MTDHPPILTPEPTPACVHRVSYPWCKVASSFSAGHSYFRWKPGVRFADDGMGDSAAVADGVGAMLLVEVGRYTPRGYRERVFYTRQFVLPSGEPVGVPRLRVISAGGFTRLRRGYRYSYDVSQGRAAVEMEPDVYPDPEDMADAASY